MQFDMKIIKKVIRAILFVLAIPFLYTLIALILSLIPVNTNDGDIEDTEVIYLSTNGVHLSIILAKSDLNESLRDGLISSPSDNFLAFGWGDEEFYLNTPTWSDLKFTTAFKAVFLQGPSLIHITRYKNVQAHWLKIKVSRSELDTINELLVKSFLPDEHGHKIHLKEAGYSFNDDFYKARGSYSCFKTCNTWVNTIFKQSGLQSCLWTPFDFGLLRKYD